MFDFSDVMLQKPIVIKLSFISELAFGRSKRNMVQLFYRGKVATSYEDDFVDLSFFKDCKAIFQQM